MREIESGRGGVASEGEQDFVRLDRLFAVLVRDAHPFAAGGTAGADDTAAEDELRAVAFHALLDGVGHVAVHRAEDLFAALDDGHCRTECAVVVGHFQRDGSGAKDDEGFGRMLVIQHVVAGQRSGFREAGNVGMTDDRAGGDEDVFAADILFAASAQAHGEFVGRGEAGVSADQGEFAAFQLVGPVFGEFGDEAALAFDDFRAVETCVLGIDPELVRFTHVLQPVG